MPVDYRIRLGLLLISGIIAIALLGQLPTLERGMQQRRESVAAFQPYKPAKTLNDDNLVDALAALPFRDRLMRVGWDHAILTVDLAGETPDIAWADMGRLIGFSYGEVSNIRQVLIRVFKRSNQERTLLMAAETRRSDWTAKELAGLRADDFGRNIPLEGKVRLSVSSSGHRWIANFAN